MKSWNELTTYLKYCYGTELQATSSWQEGQAVAQNITLGMVNVLGNRGKLPFGSIQSFSIRQRFDSNGHC